jgi:hypothetical protein
MHKINLSAHRNYLLVIALLPVLVLSFNINNWKVEALRVMVQDQDENQQDYDFLFADRNLKQIQLENRFNAIQNVRNVTDNYKDINYLDIKNVKFLYDNTNGSIIAEIVFNKERNSKFAEGTTYGMAININPFQNSSKPEITDADYIYKFIFINGSWNKVLGIQHSHGEEEHFPPEKLEQNNPLNAGGDYTRMKFNTAKIGSPEEFQVQFFASSNVKISSSLNYTLVDVVPWIEVPQSTVSLSLDPDVSKVYPWDTKKVDIVISSNSKASTDYVIFSPDLKCSNDYLPYGSLLPYGSRPCWILDEHSTIVSPAKKSHSIHAALITRNLTGQSITVTLPATDITTNGPGVTAESKDISQTWHFRVGSPYSDFIESGLDFPNKYSYIIGLIAAIGTFISGIFVSKEKTSERVKKFFESLK